MFTVREATMNKAVTADPRRKQFNIHIHYKQRKHLGCITGDSCWTGFFQSGRKTAGGERGRGDLLPLCCTSTQAGGIYSLWVLRADCSNIRMLFVYLYRCFTEFHLHDDFSNGQNNYHHCVDKDLSPTFHPSNYKFLWNNLCKVKQASKIKPGR